MKKNHIIGSLLALTILCACGNSACTPTRADRDSALFLGPGLLYLEDRERRLDIHRASSPAMALAYRPVPNDRAAMGTTKSTYWFRFTVPAATLPDGPCEDFLEVAYPSLERVELYVPSGIPGKWTVKTAGELVPYDEREVKHRNIVYPFPRPRGEPLTCYMRVDVEKVMIFPLYFWSGRAFAGKNYLEQLVHGVYFGVMLVMLFYNLFLLLSLRDRSYLFYIVYIAASTMFQVAYTGFGYEFLWPSMPEWNSRANIFFVFFAGSWALAFSASYLDIGKNVPRLKPVFAAMMGLSLTGAALTFVLDRTPATQLSNVVPFASVVLVIATGALCLKRGYRPARYYLLAWFVFLAGVVLFIMKNLRILPATPLTIYSVQFGSALEVVFFSLGLADRINSINEERERVRGELIQVQKELNIARQIQLSILPSSIPSIDGLELAVHYLPAHSVGGDYYDFHGAREGRLTLFIADASGHGLPAAQLASMVRIAFSQQRASMGNPAALLSGINRTLLGKLGGHFVTANCACFDMQKRVLVNARAGHPPLIVAGRGSGQIREYRPGGRILGVFDEVRFLPEEIALSPGDRVVLYTDGLTECRSPGGELFGDERLLEFIGDTLAESADRFIERLMERLFLWTGTGGPLEDDLTVIVADVRS